MTRKVVPSQAELSRPARDASAHRAIQLSKELIELSQRFSGPEVLNADAVEVRRLDRAWAAMHDWEPKRLARVQLLDAIDFALTWKAKADWWTANVPAWESSEPFDPAWAARDAFASAWPEYASELTDKDLKIALTIWSAMGKPRRTTNRPRKWPFLAQMMDRIGLGGITPAALSTDWQEWSAKHGRSSGAAGSLADWKAAISKPQGDPP